MLNTLPIKIKCNRLLMLGSLLACVLMTGCASFAPTVANIDIPEVANPKSGPAVRIVSVEDRREFVYPFKDCDSPSVPNAEALKNQELKARAFARKGRCGGGETTMHQLMLLPEGQTVAGVTGVIVANAFKEAGYQVINSGSADGSEAVRVKINKSWDDSGQLDGWGRRSTSSQSVELIIGESKPFAVNATFSENIIMAYSFSQLIPIYRESLLELQRKITAQLRSSPTNSQAAATQ